jgi:hypothetical protein
MVSDYEGGLESLASAKKKFCAFLASSHQRHPAKNIQKMFFRQSLSLTLKILCNECSGLLFRKKAKTLKNEYI